MNIEQLDQQVIINEWQLGQQLNNAVHNGTRDKFNLLLSFLSDDARDFGQFELKSNIEESEKETDYRRYFKLPAAQPLVNEGPSDVMLAEYNRELQATNMVDIRFKQLLRNEAILCKKVDDNLPADILDNLCLLTKQRMSITLQDRLPDTIKTQHVAPGIDASLLDEYNNMALDSRPLQVHSL